MPRPRRKHRTQSGKKSRPRSPGSQSRERKEPEQPRKSPLAKVIATIQGRPWVAVVTLIIVIAYSATRFWALTKLPIFTDEGAFIDLAEKVWQGDFFGAVPFGKLLHVWLIALTLPWTSNPLWAARAISALGGALALYACVRIGSRISNLRTGLLCGALYVISPFALFHDRIALADGLLSAFAALVLLGSIAVVQDQRGAQAYLLGLAMAGAILSKMPGLLTLFTPLLALILLSKPIRLRVVRQLAISYGITAALTAYPVMKFLLTTDQGRFSAVGDQSIALLTQIKTNIYLAYEWLWFYWTPPVFVLGIIGLVASLITKKRETLLLWATSFVPCAAFIGASKIWFPRYILLATVPMLAFVAALVDHWMQILKIDKLRRQLSVLPLLLLFLIVGLFSYRADWLLLTNPGATPLPSIDRVQYIEAWPSGFGVAEAADYLRAVAENHPEGIIVVHHDFGDAIHFGLAVYLMNQKHILFRQFYIRAGKELSTLEYWSRTNPTFVVLNRPALGQVEEQPNLTELLKVADLVKSYPKPGGRSAVDVYSLRRSGGGS